MPWLGKRAWLWRMRTYECHFNYALHPGADVVTIEAADDLHACAKADDLFIDQDRYASVEVFGADRCIATLKRDPPG
jgi:hypothetical protein